MDASPPATFLVFGDLHGRVLPAFRFGSYWSRCNRRPLAGLLQVGDLGYFPDVSRLDKATIRHAKDDPLELGTIDVVHRTEIADRTFDQDPSCPPGLWFTAGNHEDFQELERLAQASGEQPDFVVDAYCRIWGIKDGVVILLPKPPTQWDSALAELAGGSVEATPSPAALRVGAIWGVDGDGPTARQNLPPRGYVDEAAINRLAGEEFDVLLSHDAPYEAKRENCGSQPLRVLIELTQPRFAFFGHYSGDGAKSPRDFGRTEAFHLAGFELRTRGGHPESGSVGVLELTEAGWAFAFIPDEELKPFTRHNWKWV